MYRSPIRLDRMANFPAPGQFLQEENNRVANRSHFSPFKLASFCRSEISWPRFNDNRFAD